MTPILLFKLESATIASITDIMYDLDVNKSEEILIIWKVYISIRHI